MILVKMTMLYLKRYSIKKRDKQAEKFMDEVSRVCGKEEGLMVDKELWQAL